MDIKKINRLRVVLVVVLCIIGTLILISPALLLTLPKINQVSNNSKYVIAKDEASDVLNALDIWYSAYFINNGGNSLTTTFTCDGIECKTANNEKLDLKSSVPQEGIIVIDSNGNINTTKSLKFKNCDTYFSIVNGKLVDNTK